MNPPARSYWRTVQWSAAIFLVVCSTNTNVPLKEMTQTG
jgi:hypothetical protein